MDGRMETQVKQYIRQFHSIHLVDINMAPYLKCVAALPCKMLMSESQWHWNMYCDLWIMINNKVV